MVFGSFFEFRIFCGLVIDQILIGTLLNLFSIWLFSVILQVSH